MTRETSKLALRNQLQLRYGSNPLPHIQVDPPVEAERAFVTHADSGRTVITAPVREVAHANAGFTYLRGRFVEADHANDNGAMWTTEDLQMGGPTVAGGPLNWLHNDRIIIGSLLSGELVYGGTEAARKFSADQRKKAAGQGHALSDGSFPIKNAEDLHNAIRLAGKAKDPAKARAHIKKRAAALGLSNLIPDSWKSQKSALDQTPGNHIVADAAVWRFLYPDQTAIIEKAAADGALYYSMECVSREVTCLDLPGRPGCGETFAYAAYDGGQTCHHLRERSSVRRLVDPVFLGGAVIVPPVLPGWKGAEATVLRDAAALTEANQLDDTHTHDQAMALATAVLEWANRE